ncbi:hypothetical protein [Lactococcus termiticola]|nr:hypothetical protein [Lactococcus termiticola]
MIQELLQDKALVDKIEQLTYLTTKQNKVDFDGTPLYWKLDENGFPGQSKVYREDYIQIIDGIFTSAFEEQTPLENLTIQINRNN